MKKLGLSKILIGALLSSATIGGLTISLISCETSSNSTEQSNESLLKEVKNLLNDRGAITEKQLGGYDQSLNHGKFFYGIFSKITVDNEDHTRKNLLVDDQGMFFINKKELVDILKATTSLEVEKLNDEELLLLNDDLKNFSLELNNHFQDIKETLRSSISLEISIVKNTKNEIELQGKFISADESINLTKLSLTACLNDPANLIYNSFGKFLPEELIDSKKLPMQDFDMSVYGTDIEGTNPIVKKQLPGYSDWTKSYSIMDKKNWTAEQEIEVTYEANWLGQINFEATNKTKITHKQKFILKGKPSVAKLTNTYPLVENLLNRKTEDGTKLLGGYEVSQKVGNFTWTFFKMMQKKAAKVVKLSRTEVNELLSSAIGSNSLVTSLNKEDLLKLNDKLENVMSGISSFANQSGVSINLEFKKDAAIGEVFLEIKHLSKNESAINEVLTKYKQTLDEDMYNTITDKYGFINVTLPDLVTNKAFKHNITTQKANLEVPELVKKPLAGYSNWSAPVLSSPIAAWKAGENQEVSYSATWLDDKNYKATDYLIVKYVKKIKVVDSNSLNQAEEYNYTKIVNVLNGKSPDDATKLLGGYEKSVKEALFINKLLPIIAYKVDFQGNINFSHAETVSVIEAATGFDVSNLTDEDILKLKEPLKTYIKPIDDFVKAKVAELSSFVTVNIVLDILNSPNGAYIKVKINMSPDFLLSQAIAAIPSILANPRAIIVQTMGFFLPEEYEYNLTNIEYDLSASENVRNAVLILPKLASKNLEGYTAWNETPVEYSSDISSWKVGDQPTVTYTAKWKKMTEYSDTTYKEIKVVQKINVVDSKVAINPLIAKIKNVLIQKNAADGKLLSGYESYTNQGNFLVELMKNASNIDKDGIFILDKLALINIIGVTTGIFPSNFKNEDFIEISTNFKEFMKNFESFDPEMKLTSEIKIVDNNAQLNSKLEWKISKPLSSFREFVENWNNDNQNKVEGFAGKLSNLKSLKPIKLFTYVLNKEQDNNSLPDVVLRTLPNYSNWKVTYSKEKSLWAENDLITTTWEASCLNGENYLPTTKSKILITRRFYIEKEKILNDENVINAISVLNNKTGDKLQLTIGGYDAAVMQGDFLKKLAPMISFTAKNEEAGIFEFTQEQWTKIFYDILKIDLNNSLPNSLMQLNEAINNYLSPLNKISDLFPSRLSFKLENQEDKIKLVGKIVTSKDGTAGKAELQEKIEFLKSVAKNFEKILKNELVLPSNENKGTFFEDGKYFLMSNTSTGSFKESSPSKKIGFLLQDYAGYTKWSEPVFAKPIEEWKIGEMQTITYCARWLADEKYTNTQYKELTYTKNIFVLAEKTKEFMIQELNNILSGKSADGKSELDGYQYSLMKGNFYYKYWSSVKNRVVDYQYIKLNRQETIDIIKYAIGYDLTPFTVDDFAKISTTFVNFMSDLIRWSKTITYEYQGVTGKYTGVVTDVTFKFESSTAGPILISDWRIDNSAYIWWWNKSTFSNFVGKYPDSELRAEDNVLNSIGLFIKKEAMRTKYAKEHSLESKTEPLKPLQVQRNIKGYKNWSAPIYSKEMSSWAIGDEITVTYNAEWDNDPKFEQTTEKTISFVQYIKIVA